MKKLLPFVIAALMIPSVALAKGKPSTAGTHTNHGKAKVMYVLKGMVYAYTAYDSTTSTPGSITIDVNHSNRHGKLLVGQTITISTGAKTTLLLKNGVTSVAAAQPGDVGSVRMRASRLAFKSATLADLQNALTDQPAFKIIDKGPASS
jgi:hypothetical protein